MKFASNLEEDLFIFVRIQMSTQNKKETFFEVFRFLVVGGLATLVDFIVFYLFNLVILKSLNEKINMVMSTTLGFTAGLFTNCLIFKYK